eukprot:6709713-Pyramimonas_sp.AAC.1
MERLQRRQPGGLERSTTNPRSLPRWLEVGGCGRSGVSVLVFPPTWAESAFQWTGLSSLCTTTLKIKKIGWSDDFQSGMLTHVLFKYVSLFV